MVFAAPGGRKIVANADPTSCGGRIPLEKHTGAAWERSGRRLGRSPARLGTPGGALGPSRARLGALLGGLGRVRRRPLNNLDRSKPPKIAPKSIFGWFWPRFSEFFVLSSHVYVWIFACLHPGFPMLPDLRRVLTVSDTNFGFTPCNHTFPPSY